MRNLTAKLVVFTFSVVVGAIGCDPTEPNVNTNYNGNSNNWPLPDANVVPTDAVVGDLLIGEVLGDDADDGAFILEHGVGDLAHETDVATAVDEGDIPFGKELAEGAGGPGVLGFGSVGGAAVDGDGFHVVWFFGGCATFAVIP